MHDPSSRICQLRIPIPFMGKARLGYRSGVKGGWIELAEIWHQDPCTDGSDDSCGRFMRARHGREDVIDEAVEMLEMDWDSTYQSSKSDHDDDEEEYGAHENKVRYTGMFKPNGTPLMSTPGIVLNIYFAVLLQHFKKKHEHYGSRRKAMAYLNRHMAEILFFAENPVDSLHGTITRVFGDDGYAKEHSAYQRTERIRNLVSIVYGDVLRTSRPWWKSPNLHVHHWRISVPALRNLRRLLWDRCCQCHKTLGWNKSVSSNWEGTQLTCHRCSGASYFPKTND